ncbi:MAG: Glycine-tRNA ligase [Candidatus Nomurabacteria bacterium GW2011_GWB1_37_5]|uniref:glycine--tRNA ligase n=1 Tax=Candidatus Nomurabacteria bacterium GW2011_GWB1_37_5 TaxID=1618742 RepID=A0A0G0H5R4_9BACT|nr:MAG: Glycine-tRNA ligase [Candidatus Nomurabacteria bacterium GW2011_GWB1_37_5]
MQKKEEKNLLMEKIISLCKRRGFVFQGSEIYGGLGGTWDWGHFGLALKNNIKQSWWKKFVDSRRDMYGIDAAILMRQEVWQAAGHVANFADPMVECEKCKKRFRADTLRSDLKEVPEVGPLKCPECKGKLGEAKQFNMMFQTKVGASDDSSAVSYLRPETAQGMFVNFKNTVDAFHPKLPFGMAQIGKAFRNEITPRDFLFRQREFEQMEIEYFVRPADWEKYFEYWKDEMEEWMEEIGLDMAKVHDIEIPKEDLAHYSKRTVDFEFEYPFGQKELFGLAYRTDFDLKNHKLEYIDEGVRVSKDSTRHDSAESEKIVPHVIEPTFGVDRAVLALLLSIYAEDPTKDGASDKENRVYLKFKPSIAPVICAVSPLLKNKPELVEYANTKVYALLKAEFGRVAWDDNGNIGKRYRRQDEIGTPWCIVIDFDTLTDDTVTVRDRDTGKQERVKVDNLISYIKEKMME